MTQRERMEEIQAIADMYFQGMSTGEEAFNKIIHEAAHGLRLMEERGGSGEELHSGSVLDDYLNE